jgi:hypothetical protein
MLRAGPVYVDCWATSDRSAVPRVQALGIGRKTGDFAGSRLDTETFCTYLAWRRPSSD